MEAETTIIKMNDDLKRKLDNLFGMKMQPSLHLSKRFDEIISKIDYDAERIMLDLENKSKASATECQETEKVNDARFEFVRILRVLERNLRTQLLTNQPKKLDHAFLTIEQRAKELRELTVGQEVGIYDLEDAYLQLILDITEMENAEESKLFAKQTICYMSSTQQTELGSLYHLTDVFLTDEQLLGCLK